MKLLSKACELAASCPAVYDMEDGSGRLLIVGSGAYWDGEAAGIKIGPGETALWIDRKLVEDALKHQSPNPPEETMGREIRRVPANWQHPITKDGYGRDRRQPMYRKTFEQACAEWLADFDRIRSGNPDELEAECYPGGVCHWASDNRAPDPAYYRPWKDEDATWFQVWETVSEGTPVSPPFATEDELIDYLAKNGDEWDQNRGDRPWGRQQAERFVKGGGWAPSFAIIGGQMMSGVEAVTQDS